MVRWKCVLCDYEYDNNLSPDRYPKYGAPAEKFVKVIKGD